MTVGERSPIAGSMAPRVNSLMAANERLYSSEKDIFATYEIDSSKIE